MPAASKPSIAEAMAAVMEDVREVRKNQTNQHQRYNFRGIDAVMNAVGPALRKHGVVIVPTNVLSHDIVTATTTGGKTTNAVRVHVQYTAYGPAGDSIVMDVVGEAQDAADKGTAKAMSVAYRTLLLQAFTLPTDDTDPDSENAEPYSRGAQRPPEGPWAPSRVQAAISTARGDVARLKAFHDEAAKAGTPEEGLKLFQQAAQRSLAAAASQGGPPAQDGADTPMVME